MTGIIHSITQTLRSNLRQGGLVIALVAIVLLFAVLTDGQILSAQNVSNIIVQNAYVLVLAIGMLFAILMADIDLSVGSVVALTGEDVTALRTEMVEATRRLVTTGLLTVG